MLLGEIVHYTVKCTLYYSQLFTILLAVVCSVSYELYYQLYTTVIYELHYQMYSFSYTL